MIKYYQDLLNECIDLQGDYERLDRMKNTLNKMQRNMRQLRLNMFKARIQQIKLNIKKANWIKFMKGV